MKTKIFGVIALVAIAAVVALNVTMSNQKQDAANLLALANVEALAQEEGGGQKMYRIKSYCTCYNDETGSITGMSITECEEYIWNPPMVQTTCVLTNCNSGSSCS